MSYDVVVIGGGVAGCSAAYNLGIKNKKVLLIEKNIYLGGLMTGGLVTPFMKTSKNQINTDFLTAFKSELKTLNGIITYKDGNDGWVNPELSKIALDRLMQKANVEALYDTTVSGVSITNGKIDSITITSKMLSECIKSKYYIDSTGNCDFSKICNCEFLNKKDEIQPVNLRFIMSNVDVKKFGEWLLDFDKDRNVTTVCDIDGVTHLSTAYTWDTDKKWALSPLFDKAVEEGVLKNEDRNYFQVFTIPNMPNSIAFNAPRIYSENVIDPIDKNDFSKAIIQGRESILRLSEFCKKYLVGFENAYISSIADMLGVRVSRRIKGKYIYTIDDLKSGRTFNHPVVVSNYPVDVHSLKNNTSVLEQVDIEYQLPVEALLSTDIENLAVVGRCLSADFLAQGALRIIPSCMSMGEGLAKYLLEQHAY